VLLAQHVQSFLSGGRLGHPESLWRQHRLKQADVLRQIIHDEYERVDVTQSPPPHLRGICEPDRECTDTDRLLYVPVEAGIQGPFPILLHCLGRYRDHGYVRCPRALAQPAKSLHAIDTGQLEIHENEIGRLADRQGDAVLGRPSHPHVVACVLKHVPQQLEIPLVVLHDQDHVGHPDSEAGDWRLALAQRSSPARPDRSNSVLRATYVIRPCSPLLVLLGH
jgi:hypothetical protein